MPHHLEPMHTVRSRGKRKTPVVVAKAYSEFVSSPSKPDKILCVEVGATSSRPSSLAAITGKKRAAQMDGPAKKMCVLGVME